MNIFDYFFENTKYLEKDFVIGNQETVSFQDLYINSLKIAGFLQKNIGTGQNIILIKQNSVFFITAYLGILKSGNVCVPLDFSIEKENLKFIKELSKSKTIFYDKRLSGKIDLAGFTIKVEDEKFVNILKSGKKFTNNTVFDAESLAEIIFTSGSTGKPKGVMLSHKNMIANTKSIITYLNLTKDDRMCVVLPFYYCYGLSLLHTHLRIGGSIVLNNTFVFIGTVINDLINYKCTGFAGVPSHFQILLKKSKSFKQTEFPHLKYVTQAGGKLHNVFIEEFVEAFPEINFYVMYGQTEATARLAYLPPNQVISKLGSIGKSIPDVQLKLVNKEGDIIDNSEEEGELIAKGENIMLGYFKDELETAQVLKNGWLYTGDIAKRDKEGFLYLVARKKEIIKVNGKRISPKEIEQVILDISHVVDCTIRSIFDEVQGEALMANVVIDDINQKNDVQVRILNHCKKRLAFYKIPQKFEFNSQMNLKSSGKKVS